MSFVGILVLIAGFMLTVVVTVILAGILDAIGVPAAIWAWPVIGAWLIIPIVLYWRYTRIRDRRRERAARRTWRSTAETIARADLGHRLDPFPTFSKRIGSATHGLFSTKADGAEISVFDFAFTSIPKILPWVLSLPIVPWQPLLLLIRSRKQTVVLCRRPGVALPQFFLHLREAIAKQGIFDQDLGQEVPLSTDLSGKYLLRGAHPDRLRELFVPEILSYYSERGVLHTEATGDCFIVYEPGRILRPEQITPFIDEAVALLNLFTAALQGRGTVVRPVRPKDNK
jgi:hypothetical protein